MTTSPSLIEPALTEFESKLAKSLKEAPAEWTSACCSEDTLWDFAEQGGKHAEALNLIRHISSCAYCTQGYLTMKETLQLQRQLSASVTPEPELTSPPPQNPVPTWQERLQSFLQASRVRSRLQLAGMALAGAAIMLLLLGPRLQGLNRQQEVARQAQKELQATRQALEMEQKTTRQLLASARTESNNRTMESFPTSDTIKILEALKSRSATMGTADNNAIQLLSPRGTEVSSLRPLLVWKLVKPIPEASKYEITIVNAQTQEEHVLTRDAHTQNDRVLTTDKPRASQQEFALQIPASLLKPATKYRWSIEVKDSKNVLLASSPLNEETFFRTPTASEMGQLGQDYARMGALEDAEEALSADLQSASSRRTLERVRKLRADLRK